jgi:hypothetical protein
MIIVKKQTDGTWKRSGEPLPSEEPVSITFGNYNPEKDDRSFLVCDTAAPPMGDHVRHSVEGDYTYAEAIAIVQKLIDDGKLDERKNVCLIQSSVFRVIDDARALAMRDALARYPQLATNAPSCRFPRDDYPYHIEVMRAFGSDTRTIHEIYCAREEAEAIVEPLRQKHLSGRISDPSGRVIEEWKAE